MKKSTKGIVYIALCIDDNVMISDIVAIDDAIEALKSKGPVLKVVKGLKDYLSYEIKISDDKKRAWIEQPHLIKNVEKEFGECMQDFWSHKIPGTPKFLI